MTLYDLAISIPEEQRKQLSHAGLLSRSITRYIYVYEMYLQLIDRGVPRMDAYIEISNACFTCDENVRKIVQKMKSTVITSPECGTKDYH